MPVISKPAPKRIKPAHTPPPGWRELEFISLNEAASVLRCSTSHIVKLLRQKEIRAVKPGSKVLIDVGSVVQMLDSAVDWLDAKHPRGPHKQREEHVA